jgi:tRNA threonylcarbamoyladenosine biosynthesis protein TsaB
MTPRILAIDTSGESASIALLDPRGCAETHFHSTDGYGHLIFGHLQEFLTKANISLNEVDCLAAAAGPGSFTGLRVALSAVKGLAEATGKPAVAVSNLEAMAWFGEASLRCALIDARRGEIYGAVYDEAGLCVVEESVQTPERWLGTIPKSGLEIVAQDAPDLLQALTAPPWTALPIRIAPRFLAPAVARIAARRFLSGLAQPPEALLANYVRRSDAELKWTDA